MLTFLRENFFDKKFIDNKKKYVLQCLAATGVVYLVLTTLSLIISALVIASIASTSFLVFSAPHSERSKARYIIGGYSVGFLIGAGCFYLMDIFIHHWPLLKMHMDEIFGALAVGLSIFLMVILDLEHPPASAAALAFVLNQWNIWTIIVTYLALIIIISSRTMLKRYLIELI